MELKEIDARAWTNQEVLHYMEQLKESGELVWSRVGLLDRQCKWLDQLGHNVINVTITADRCPRHMVELTKRKDADLSDNNSRLGVDSGKSLEFRSTAVIGMDKAELVGAPPQLFTLCVLALLVAFFSLFIAFEAKGQIFPSLERGDEVLVFDMTKMTHDEYMAQRIKLDILFWEISAEELGFDLDVPPAFIGDMEVVQVDPKAQRGHYLHIMRPRMIDTIGIRQDFTQVPIYRCGEKTFYIDKAIKFYYPQILPVGTIVKSFPIVKPQ